MSIHCLFPMLCILLVNTLNYSCHTIYFQFTPSLFICAFAVSVSRCHHLQLCSVAVPGQKRSSLRATHLPHAPPSSDYEMDSQRFKFFFHETASFEPGSSAILLCVDNRQLFLITVMHEQQTER